MTSTDNLKPTIFLAFANDRIDGVGYLRNLPDEARRLRAILEKAQAASLCEVVVRQNATAADILDLFQDPVYRNRIAVFHYGGHANGYQLLLETAAGATAAAGAGGLASFLGHQKGLALVFLNGCSTQPQVEGLLDAGVAAVIATSQAIEDAIAVEFAERFYRSLAAGDALQTAYSLAAAAVQTAHEGQGSATRHLYLPNAGPDSRATDRWPWDLFVRPGAELATRWNLPDAADDPLFGLPPLPQLDLPDSPFRSLQWFRREDAPVFFGRGYEVRDLFQRVTAADADPIMLFYGQSGVGKSSLLAAGLLPRLEQDYAVCYLRRMQETGLSGALDEAIKPGELITTSASNSPLRDAWLAAEQSANRPLVVIVDQVEEVFTRPHPDHPDELDEFLAAAATIFGDRNRRPHGRLILGFRKEWLAEIEKQFAEHKLPRAKVFLERLDRRGIVEAVEGVPHTPALQRRFGLSVEQSLAGIIADDLLDDRDSAVAPTLQILLTKLWDEATRINPATPRFDLTLYQQLKRQGIALGDFIDQRLAALAAWQKELVESGLALDLLHYHTTSLGTAEQRALAELQAHYAHRSELMPQLVQQFKDNYLLVDSGGPQQEVTTTSRLAHDALAPLVRARFDESDLSGQRARRILENRAVDWQAGATGTPLDETDLTAVEAGHDGMRQRLSVEQRLIEASVAARRQRKEAEERLKTERAEAQRREQKAREDQAAADARIAEEEKNAGKLRKRAFWLAGAAALAALLALAAGVFYLQANDARGKAETEAKAAATSATEAAVARATAVVNEQAAREAEATAIAAKATAEDNAVKAANAEAEALAAKAEVERLTRGIRADQLTAKALNIRDEHPMRPLLLAVEGLRAQHDFTATRVITEIAALANSAAVTHEVVAGDIVVASAQSNVHELLTQPWGIPLIGHEDSVDALAFSPDGRWLATGSWDGTARLWDMADAQAQPIVLAGHEDAVTAVAFSPDGRWLATGSWDGTARLWDVSDAQAQPIVLAGHEDDVYAVAFSPDGRRLATGSEDKTARLWDVADPQAQPIVLAGHENTVNAVAFSPDGRWLATGSYDNTARLWDVTDPQAQPIVLAGHDSSVDALAFSPDGRWLATGSEDKTARLWDMTDPQAQPIVLAGHERGVSDVAFSPDGRWLATGSEDNTARLWHVTDPQAEPIILAGHEDTVYTVAFSPDGRWLATGSYDDTARLWDVTDPQAEPIVLAGHEGSVLAVAFSPEGRWLATGSWDHTARLWDVTHPRAEPIVLARHAGAVNALAFSPDGRWLATGSNDTTARLWDVTEGSYDRTARLWDVTDAQAEPIVLAGHEGPINAVAFSPDGRWLATGSDDNTARLWDVTDPQSQPILLAGHEGSVLAVAFSPDGRWLATGSADSTARLWDVTDPQALPIVLADHEGAVWALAFSPDGRRLATGSDVHTARLWDVTDPQAQPIVLAGHEGAVNAVAFSPDGRWLATAGWLDNTARLWDVTDPQAHLTVLTGHGSGVWAVAFSPDGRWLATGSSDNTARLWDMTDPQAEPIVLAGHEGWVNAVAFSPDGRWLATGSTDSTARLWDVTDPQAQPIVLAGHEGPINAVAFSPDGRWLATRSGDYTARLWTLQIDDLIELACGLVTRNLDLTEWQIYLGDKPYRPTCRQRLLPASLIEPYQEQGQAFIDAGYAAAAAAAYQAALAKIVDPEVDVRPLISQTVASLLVEQGRSVAGEGNVDQAAALFEQALTYDPALDLEPEAAARRLAALTMVEQARTLAGAGKVDEAISLFEQALTYDPTLAIVPVLDANLQAARGLAESGIYTGAMSALVVVQTISPTLDITMALSANQWNSICWDGSLAGAAGVVLTACERAVARAPYDREILDSRGLARTLTGDFEGAIADFEAAIRWAEETGYDANFIQARMAWIADLKAGKNPLDAAALEQLRNP